MLVCYGTSICPTTGRGRAISLLPNLVAASIIRELSPLLTAIIVAGRYGSAIAAELGSMKVSQEIEVRGLMKRYGTRRILDGLDLIVKRGETLVILDTSGSGKITLLRSLVGLERPDAGSVYIQGVDLYSANPKSLSALRRNMGMAFQGGALFGSMTLAENVDLPLSEFTRLPVSTRLDHRCPHRLQPERPSKWSYF